MDSIIKMLDKTLDYVSHELIEDTIYVTMISSLKKIKCPDCGNESNKVHSKYQKNFQDLPIQGKKAIIVLKNKNIFCVSHDCQRYTFSEKFSFLSLKANKTKRLIDEIIRISLTQSSVSAAKYLSEKTVDIKKSLICNYLKNSSNK